MTKLQEQLAEVLKNNFTQTDLDLIYEEQQGKVDYFQDVLQETNEIN